MKWMQQLDVKEVRSIVSYDWIVSPVTAVLTCLLLGALLLLTTLHQNGLRIPGPASLPLVGNLLLFRSERKLHVACNKIYKVFGPIFRLQLGAVNAVVVTDGKLIREVQRKQVFAGRASTMGFTRLISNGGNDLAFSDVSPSWKFHHKFVHANMFQRNDLHRAERQILTEADVLCKDLLQYADSQQPIDSTWKITVAVTNVVFAMLFGKRLKSDDPRLIEWRRSSELLVRSLSSGGLLHCMPWLKKLPGFSGQWKQVVKCQENNWNLMGQFLKDAVSENCIYEDPKEAPLATRLVSAAMEQTGDTDINSFTTTTYEEALNSKNDPTEVLQPAQIRSILLDLLGAGSDTTTHTMRWLVALVVKHSDIQKRIQQEIDTSITGEPTAAHRSATPLLDAVVQETLRLYPAAPLSVPHSATTDTCLGSYHVPKDTVLLLNLYGIMRDPNIWDKPDTFNPDRFLTTDETQRKTQQQHFMPFSAGVRACMGKHLAQMTLYLIAAKLFKSYHIEEVPGEPIDLEPQEDGESPIPKPFQVLISRRSPAHKAPAA